MLANNTITDLPDYVIKNKLGAVNEMRIDVVMHRKELDGRELAGRAVVVFDVLRATSSVVAALAGGSRGIIPCAGLEEGRSLAASLREKGRPVVLAGERGGLKPPGFDLGNSPREFAAGAASGRYVVLSTTNGTKTVRACTRAAAVYLGSIVNAAAVAGRLAAEKKDVLLACAGTQEKFSLEDGVAAGLVVWHLVLHQAGPQPGLTDAAMALYRLAGSYGSDPGRCLWESNHGQKLIKLGLEGDLKWCARAGSYTIVPRLQPEEGLLLIKA